MLLVVVTGAELAETSVHHLLLAFQGFQSQNERLTSALIDTHGVGATELRALLILRVHGSVPLKRLGQLLGQVPSTTTFIADRLEKRRLLMRRANPSDRRSVLAQLTSEGEVVVGDIWDRYRTVFEDAVSPNDRSMLARTFIDLTRSMSERSAS